MPPAIGDYAAFLPPALRDAVVPPAEDTWWPWRGDSIHLARTRHRDAAVRLWVIHGAGGWSGALWPLASLAMTPDVDVTAIDLPLYGRTRTADPADVRYPDWIDLLSELTDVEDDGRPLVVFGASMGGMLAYEVAARTRAVSHVMATCLLDVSDPLGRRAAARNRFLAAAAPSMLALGRRVAPRMRLPIRWVTNMKAMSLDPALSALCARDPLGGGVQSPVGFLASYFEYRHHAPERFDVCPVTLAHPARDEWTAPELSIAFARRIAAPTEIALLDGCGHFPIEEPGVFELARLLRGVISSVARA